MFLIISSSFFIILCLALYHANKKLPVGLSSKSEELPACNVKFLADLTWYDQDGKQHLDQQIFSEFLNIIKFSRKCILLDMFLLNDFEGKDPGGFRSLSAEITEALVEKKKQFPEMNIVVITDPVNTVYGSYDNLYFRKMERAGITIVLTELNALRDSNFLYSPLWRLFAKPFGTCKGRLLPNPLGTGRISLRSFLKLLNFKANHRKLIISDQGDDWAAIVTSANIHDGSAAHGNVGLRFSGPAVQALYENERSVACFSGYFELPMLDLQPLHIGRHRSSLTIVTEGQMKSTLLAELSQAQIGDKVYMVIFYLSSREVISALKRASLRGVLIKIILDPNKDAFGRKKSGIPNRQAASELVGEGVAVRWGNTHGEQLHSKLIHIDYRDGKSIALLGSSNYTRRNLNDYNLEANIMFKGSEDELVFLDVRQYFSILWNNAEGGLYSVDYEQYADSSKVRRVVCRIAETTGMCTF